MKKSSRFFLSIVLCLFSCNNVENNDHTTLELNTNKHSQHKEGILPRFHTESTGFGHKNWQQPTPWTNHQPHGKTIDWQKDLRRSDAKRGRKQTKGIQVPIVPVPPIVVESADW